jgi:hypothetical protein
MMVLPTHSVLCAQVLQGWGVSAEDAARMEQQGVVVQAVTFVVTKRNH